MPKAYAENTSVSVAKSQGEINSLLQNWGCDGIRWTNMIRDGRSVLEFTWLYEENQYLARISLELPDDATLRERSSNARSGRFMQSKYEKALASTGRQEHRILLLWLKATFNAIQLGIVSAETVFLPFFVGKDGRTVAETALPQLSRMLISGTDSILGLPEGS